MLQGKGRLHQLCEKQLTWKGILVCNRFMAKTQPLMSQVNALVFVWVAANNVLSYRGAQKRQLTRINMTSGNGAVATNLSRGMAYVVKTSG